VFLAGLFVGQRMMKPIPPAATAAFRDRERAAERTAERQMPAVIDRIAEALAPQDRSVFLEIMDKHRPAIMAAGAAVRETRSKVRDQFTADTIDRPAIETEMGELRERQAAMQQTLQQAMLDAAQALPPEARRQMVSLGGRRGGRE